MTIAPTFAARKAELNARYDIEPMTGFMPDTPPLDRLPVLWDPWEQLLDRALARKLKLGSLASPQEAEQSLKWREEVRMLRVEIPSVEGETEGVLRRARHVLSFLLHLYVHTQPPTPTTDALVIPLSISLPLSAVSDKLDLPLVMTYSDNVLYNWRLGPSPSSTFYDAAFPGYEQLSCLSTFTGTTDEQHFYLVSAHIELRGAEALSIMHIVDNELIQSTCVLHWTERRTIISILLSRLSEIIDDLTKILLSVRDRCDPAVFYYQIRPWFVGVNPTGRAWVFEGLETQPKELAGSSAGQSALIHALDAFLGVQMPSQHSSPESSSLGTAAAHAAFVERMRVYMPRKHRHFLAQIREEHALVRTFILESGDRALLSAYNNSLTALQGFRDAHIRIATLYIVNQAHSAATSAGLHERPSVLGTGGSNLLPFLKGVRDMTKASTLNQD